MNFKYLMGIPLVAILLQSCQDNVPSQVNTPPHEEYRVTKSNTVIDCNNGKFNDGKFTTIIIHSDTERLQNITIRNCELKGSIRMFGLGRSGADPALNVSSHSLGHTQRAQDAAPTNITITNVKIEENGDIPIYVSPGVTNVTIEDVQFTGKSNSVAIYLAAESSHNKILNNTFDIDVAREVIAVDGSAHNRIVNNTFNRVPLGGIYLYRNCGEDGTVRHQSPQYNIIEGNALNLVGLKSGEYGIWLASRNGNRKYCNLDSAFPFGSGVSDLDYANFNVLKNNIFKGSTRTIRDDGENNVIQ